MAVRIWRVGERILAELGSDFALVDPTGSVERWFRSRVYSDEDDLWRWTHVVIGNRLTLRTTIERRCVETRHEDQPVLDNLSPVDDPAMIALVEGALRRHRDRTDEERHRAEQEAKGRVAALLDPLAGEQVTGTLALARDALARRIQAHADPIAARLLGTLGAVARARPGPDVVAAFARGCRLACFEQAPPEPDTGAVEQAEPTPPGALATELLERARELEQQATWQEDIDATRNAAAYRRAAEAMRRAARLAGPPS